MIDWIITCIISGVAHNQPCISTMSFLYVNGELQPTQTCERMYFFFYPGAETRSNFEGGSGLIHLNDVRCDGTESGLLNCQYNPNTLECSHAYDAGIYCRPREQ